jgi:hypothetical protein
MWCSNDVTSESKQSRWRDPHGRRVAAAARVCDEERRATLERLKLNR